MASNVETLRTERLILRGIEEADAENIVFWRSEPGVYRYFKYPHQITLQEHLQWFFNSYLLNEDRFDWICLEKDREKKIGVFGLLRNGSEAEVNYLLAPSAQHRGYAREGVLALMEYAAENWKVRSVLAEIHKENKPSIHFITNLGFQLKQSRGDFDIYGAEV